MSYTRKIAPTNTREDTFRKRASMTRKQKPKSSPLPMPSSASILNTTAYYGSNNSNSDIPIATSILPNSSIDLPRAHTYIQNPEYERRPSIFDKITTLFRRPKIQPSDTTNLLSKRARGGKKNRKSQKRSR
jgi:hypothetical protein